MTEEMTERLLSEEYTDDDGIIYESNESTPEFESWEEFADAAAYRRMIDRWGLRDYVGGYGYGEKGHFVWEFNLDDLEDEDMYEDYPERSFSSDWDDVRSKLIDDDNVVRSKKQPKEDSKKIDIKYKYLDDTTDDVYSIIMESDDAGCRLIAKRIKKND